MTGNERLPCGFASIIPLPHLSTLHSRRGLEFDLEGGRIEIRLAERLRRFGLGLEDVFALTLRNLNAECRISS